jgi:23S rRNA (uracil1939-C5)-methyltransferase
MQQLEIKFSGLAYPGRAFGRDDTGRMIFAPFGLLKERALIEVIESHQRWAQGRILEILEPSGDRIPPRCQHYTLCGGCHYQHIPYEKQLQVKRDIVQAQLERLGDFENLSIESMIPSPSPWHYRNHIQFSLDHQGQLGFHAPQSDVVVPIRECHLPDELLSDLWPRLDFAEIPGLERVSLRSGKDDSRMVIFHSEMDPDIELDIDLPACVVWLNQFGLIVLAGESHLLIESLGRPFRVSAGSFFQVNSGLSGELVHQVLALLEPRPQETIFDLYAGVGLFSAFIAETGARLLAIEESSWATEDFIINLDEFNAVELFEAPIEIALPSINIKADGVVVDPPRAGLGREVVAHLLQLSPERLVYVSCDPATLARDAKALVAGGYQLEKVIPLDLFPQTYHIETISLFRR